MVRTFGHPIVLLFSLIFFFTQCIPSADPGSPQASLQELMTDVESISGRREYLTSPFLSAGDRLYLVGHQDGRFPDLGWHVTGEMGGIWDHPIKLMDGFAAGLETEGQVICLTAADTFINYPFANKHIYVAVVPGLKVERFQFVPDGEEAVVVEFTFVNEGTAPRDLNFIFDVMVDLRPVWLGERTGMEDGADFSYWDEATGYMVAKDSLNDWFAVWGSTVAPASNRAGSANCDYERRGRGVNATLTFPVSVPPQGKAVLPLVIAGSYTSLAAAQETVKRVLENKRSMLQRKKDRYSNIAATARLTIPDKAMEQAFRWTKYNVDWLIREVPQIGRGLSAGSPDYPWWFGCDSEYALQGVLATGRTDIVFSTIELLNQLSERTNGNGRIIHEASTNGAVFNPGNINETPQFASLVWTVYQWTGDLAFLEKMYPVVRKGLSWLLAENDADSNLLPDGFGMMEIHGLDSEMIDVAVYTQKAFADAAKMAEVLNEPAQAEAYRQYAEQLKEVINTDFWVPAFNSYADFIGTAGQAVHLIDDATVRADTLDKPWAVEELKATKAVIAGYPPTSKQGFVVHHNWVVNTPMETGIADTVKALAALEMGGRFVNPFGVFVTGIDRDESAGTDEGSFAAGKKVFSYTGAVMTLPTGVQAIAENNYGRPDAALDYLQRLTRSFSFALPGSIYEVSPDFGMMTQAWTVYSFAVPVVGQFFGIRPRAFDKSVDVRPQMPASWEEASLENLKIGDNSLNISYQKQGEKLRLTFGQSREDWKLMLAFPQGRYTQWRLNGEKVTAWLEDGLELVELTGKTIIVELE